MYLSSHLAFDGTCDEAMTFYANLFEGKVQFKMTWGEAPMPSAPEDKDKIMHMSVTVGQTSIMCADSPTGRHLKAQGIVESISISDLAKAESVFKALSEGGSIQMAFAETF